MRTAPICWLLLAAALSLSSCALALGFSSPDFFRDSDDTVPPIAPQSLDPGVPGRLIAGEQIFFFPTYLAYPAPEVQWDFGGGARLDPKQDDHWRLTALEPGTYSGTMTATNPHGQATADFNFEVVAAE